MSITQFMGQPHAYANAHTLYPYADKVVRDDHMKKLSLSTGGDFTEIRGENKVAFCDIQPCSAVNPLPHDLMRAMTYTQDKDLEVLRVTYGRPNPSAVATYFLPWRENYMMRIKLKPSPHHARQGQGVVLDPDLFVTAALQGCSVIVTGEPAQPVVYHLNAQQVKGPGGETFGGDDTAFIAAAQAKVGHMQTMFGQARTEFPKAGAKVGTVRQAPAQAVTQGAVVTDYMIGAKPGPNAALASFYKQQLGVKSLSVEQYGTVFGIRSGGTWKFYRQTRTRLSYTDPKTRQSVNQWVNPVCSRFWP
jgi:hypothetical protein